MNFTLIMQWWTVIAFVFFLGVLVWAFLPKRRAEFEEAANLPLEEENEADAKATTNTAHSRAEKSNG